MKSKKKVSFYLILMLFPMAAVIFHSIYLKPSIEEAYAGHSDYFTKFILNSLYPRFYIEKERFNLAFFLNKSDQVIYRFLFVYYTLVLLHYLYKERIRERITNLFYIQTSSKSIIILRSIYFSYFTYLCYELFDELISKQSLINFYKPIHLLSLFHVPFPSRSALLIISVILFFSILMVLINKRILFFSTLSLSIFLLLQSWNFSFEKFDHGYVTFTYTFFLLPFLFDEQRKNKPVFSSWSLQLIRITIAMVYLLSSLEKIFTSQLSWLNPNNLRTYLSFHETLLSKLVAQSDLLCIILSTGALTVQLSFVLIMFFPRLKWIWIGGGIIFHLGTYFLMKIGILFNPWIIVYIFFFDWSNVYNYFEGKFKKLNLLSR